MKLNQSSVAPFFRSAWCVLALCALTLTACKRADSPAAAVPAAAAPAAAAPAPSTSAAPSAAKVKGRWLRPDGGYILAVTAIDAEGRADAGYFNPSPIRVAWATVKTEGADLKLTVELRDTNYPGCIYKLTYLPEKDRLIGSYFQAQQQQTYDVEFVREP